MLLAAASFLTSETRAASWADVRIQPREVPVLRLAGPGEAQITVEFENNVPVPLRVEDVRFVYYRGDTVLAQRRPAADFFDGSRFARERRLDRDGRITWQAVCLVDVPPDADRIRLEVVLSARRRYEEGRKLVTASADLVPTPESMSMTLPFRGYWRVTQTNGCGSNHRIGGRGGEFAWDFAAIDRRGNVMPDRAKRNEESPTFGRLVLSPVSGRVVRVVDEYDDNQLDDLPRRSLLEDLRRPDWVFGNHVVVQASPSRFVLFAHLEKGSALVKEGHAVEAGAPLARSGNSGNSMAPHLHVQVMDRPDPSDPEIRGVPVRFLRYVEIRGAGSGDEREIVVRKVSEGIPEEAAVVAPDPDASHD